MSDTILKVAKAAINQIRNDTPIYSLDELRSYLIRDSKEVKSQWEIFSVGKLPDIRLTNLWNACKETLSDGDGECYLDSDDLLSIINVIPEKVLPEALIPKTPKDLVKSAGLAALPSLQFLISALVSNLEQLPNEHDSEYGYILREARRVVERIERL